MENIQVYINEGVSLVITHGPRILLAILTLFIGLFIIKKLTKSTKNLMKKRELDESLRPFFSMLISITLKALLIISVMGMVGVEMTSFIAILGAAGLAIGLALSGTLQNFAGGVIILIFRPFKVGDFIEAQGHMGSVKEIQIFSTILLTPDNRTIIIPNSPLSSGSMVNYSAQAQRRVDLKFGIGYNDDIDKTKEVLQGLIKADTRILKEPEPFIAVSELGDSSVNFAVRLWVNTDNYWPVFFEMTENVKKEFDKQKISIPFPQRDVHIFNQNN
ncbi:MAG: mechanosensitive ion channel [Bacteroidales bacterium]|nr:mechanosensitive ion channel [Bacteroidales bacterium]